MMREPPFDLILLLFLDKTIGRDLGVRTRGRGHMSGYDFPKKVRVMGYSGYRLNERPLSFVLDDHEMQVVNVIDRWHGEEYEYFKLLADDGRVYLIKWHRIDDAWFVVRIMERLGKH